MKKILLGVVSLWLAFSSPAFAVNVNIDGLPAATSVTGTSNLFECEQGGVNNQCTSVQIAAYIYSLMNSDCTASGTGGVTCLKTNGTAFGALATVPPGTGIAAALAANVGSAGAPILFNGAGGTPTSLVGTNITGTGAGFTAGTVTTNANLTGDVTSVGNATTLTNAPVIAKVLTGFTSGAGTVSAADSILSALQKINGNVALNAPLASPTFTGVPAAPTATVGTNTTQLATTAFVIANAGSGTGANPTATASETAVNGVATTFMRSDAAPAVQKTSASVFGLAKVDGTTITAASGVITAVPGVTSRTVTGATDTILAGDRGNVVYYNSASSIAVSQPAPSGSFAAGFFTTLCNVNTGIPTITPGSGTIINASTYPIPAGISFASASCVSYQSDGTNFNAVDIQAAYGANVQAALGKTANGTGGFGTVGTSGANVGLLNGTNTFSGAQTFGEVIGGGRTVSGTTDTLATTDCGTTITYSNAGAVTVTVPQGLPSFCVIALIQLGAGKVSTNGSAVSPATQHAAGSFTGTRAQFSVINITNYTTNTVILSGDAS